MILRIALVILLTTLATPAIGASAELPIRTKIVMGRKLADNLQAWCVGDVDGNVHEYACRDLLREYYEGMIDPAWEPAPEVFAIVETAGGFE